MAGASASLPARRHRRGWHYRWRQGQTDGSGCAGCVAAAVSKSASIGPTSGISHSHSCGNQYSFDLLMRYLQTVWSALLCVRWTSRPDCMGPNSERGHVLCAKGRRPLVGQPISRHAPRFRCLVTAPRAMPFRARSPYGHSSIRRPPGETLRGDYLQKRIGLAWHARLCRAC